jgi:hypothetical protein
MINLFEAQDSNKLVESITTDKLTNLPSALPGAPGCINFQGADKRIAVCVKDDAMVQELIKAFMDFMRCRAGDSLKELSWDEMRKILLASCVGKNSTLMGQLGFGGPKLGHGANSTVGGLNNLPSLSGNNTMNNTNPDINPYYADLKVPGS